MSDSVEAVWVIANYEGEQAKKVLAQAETAIGYILLEQGGPKSNPQILVAFRYVSKPNEPVPHHLQQVKDPFKIQEYERTRKRRQNTEGHQEVKKASDETVQRVREVLENRRVKNNKE